MSILKQRDFARDMAIQAAKEMADAARTAPKAVGHDRLEIGVVTGDQLLELAAQMEAMCAQGRAGEHYVRDAGNVKDSDCCLLIGTRTTPMPRGCTGCGMVDCANRNGYKGGSPCVYAVHDLGVAVGSAVSLAADKRIDNRVMMSAGAASIELGWLGEARVAMGIPLSVRGKSPFFDRK